MWFDQLHQTVRDPSYMKNGIQIFSTEDYFGKLMEFMYILGLQCYYDEAQILRKVTNSLTLFIRLFVCE